MALDPYHLTPAASINRVRLVDAPGLPDDLRGKTAYDLLGRQAIINRMLAACPELSALPPATLPDLPRYFDTHYVAVGHPAAETVIETTAAYLAYVLLTLNMGTPASRAARPDWDASYWEYWAQVRQIIFGGGLAAGLFGQQVIARTADRLNGRLNLAVAPDARQMPLVGAARTIPVPAAHPAWALVIDAGQTAIKAGIAQYTGQALNRLVSLPVLSAPRPESGPAVLSGLVEAIRQGWMAVSALPELSPAAFVPVVAISLASYVINRQPATDGFYGKLRDCLTGDAPPADVTTLLAHTLSAAVFPCPVTVHLLHDGTAAAHAWAGTAPAAAPVAAHVAVIMLGTALGIGFAPPAASLRPLTATFTVSAAG